MATTGDVWIIPSFQIRDYALFMQDHLSWETTYNSVVAPYRFYSITSTDDLGLARSQVISNPIPPEQSDVKHLKS